MMLTQSQGHSVEEHLQQIRYITYMIYFKL